MWPDAPAHLHAPPYEPCEFYQSWEAARDEAHEALHAWFAAPTGAKAAAFAVYRAAAEREDRAAEFFMLAEVEEVAR